MTQTERSARAMLALLMSRHPTQDDVTFAMRVIDEAEARGRKAGLEEAAKLIEADCESDCGIHSASSGVEPQDYFAWQLAQKIRKLTDAADSQKEKS